LAKINKIPKHHLSGKLKPLKTFTDKLDSIPTEILTVTPRGTCDLLELQKSKTKAIHPFKYFNKKVRFIMISFQINDIDSLKRKIQIKYIFSFKKN